jgi:hypothetical protein
MHVNSPAITLYGMGSMDPMEFSDLISISRMTTKKNPVVMAEPSAANKPPMLGSLEDVSSE